MFFENPDEYQFFRNSLEHYIHLANFSQDCLWEKKLPGNRIRWIDSGHKRVFGYQIENEYISQYLWEAMIHPDDRNLVLAKLSVAVTEPDTKIWEQEYRFRNSAGEFIPVYDRVCIIRNSKKKATKLLGITQDISKRVLKQQQQLAFLITDQQKKDKEMLAFRDGENERIGRELFDNIGQALTVSKMHLDMAVSSESQHQEHARKGLQYLTEVITEIRLLANGLVKPHINSVGIFEILRGFIAEISMSKELRIRLSVQSVVREEISERLQQILYRIIQIQVNNVIDRCAGKASIRISKENNNLVLVIADDGRKQHSSRQNKAVLTTIKRRAELEQGNVTTASAHKSGYTLTVSIPLKAPRSKASRSGDRNRKIAANYPNQSSKNGISRPVNALLRDQQQ
jgi:PAS domain S-box-containing protein